jgi:hypothetical protein
MYELPFPQKRKAKEAVGADLVSPEDSSSKGWGITPRAFGRRRRLEDAEAGIHP